MPQIPNGRTPTYLPSSRRLKGPKPLAVPAPSGLQQRPGLTTTAYPSPGQRESAARRSLLLPRNTAPNLDPGQPLPMRPPAGPTPRLKSPPADDLRTARLYPSWRRSVPLQKSLFSQINSLTRRGSFPKKGLPSKRGLSLSTPARRGLRGGRCGYGPGEQRDSFDQIDRTISVILSAIR